MIPAETARMDKAHVSHGVERTNDLDTTLERHLTLTPAEQLERARIKKEKLWIKDRLLALGQPV